MLQAPLSLVEGEGPGVREREHASDLCGDVTWEG